MSVTGGLAGGAGSACPVGPARKPRAAAGGVAQSVYWYQSTNIAGIESHDDPACMTGGPIVARLEYTMPCVCESGTRMCSGEAPLSVEVRVCNGGGGRRRRRRRPRSAATSQPRDDFSISGLGDLSDGGLRRAAASATRPSSRAARRPGGAATLIGARARTERTAARGCCAERSAARLCS